MQLIVLGTEAQKAELITGNKQSGLDILSVTTVSHFLDYSLADAYLDLLFINEVARVSVLKQLQKPVLINSVTDTLDDIGANFIRVNAWPGFLTGPILEMTSLEEPPSEKIEAIFQCLQKTIGWLPDEPGFVTPRVISMIINEAYMALEEGVSTKEEIDKAMKLGTAYPYGPFEWGARIGLYRVAGLLTALSRKEPRYSPSELLVAEAFSGGTKF